MKKHTTFYFLLKAFLAFTFLLLTINCQSQPNVDIVSFNSQHFISNYSDSTKNKLYTQDYFLSLFLPVKFGKGHVFMLRINAEQLTITRTATVTQNYNLYSLSLPIGLQLQSKNEKWKFTGIAIPKINSDFADNLNYDIQLGGIGLVTRVFSKTFQVRGGLYYNTEYWGHFFMPLLGVDWKVNERFRMYGTLPANYRFEYQLGKRFYTGIGFRSAQRSFRLQQKYNDDFVRVRENQLKVFFEGFVIGKILVGVDFYRSVNYNLISYNYFETKTATCRPTLFSKSKDAWGVTLNLAYRIRAD